MRHKKSGRQFGRDTSSRRAMLRNLAANLITHERIETTEAKAKELRRVAEKLISKATGLGKVGFTPQTELSAEDKAKRLHVARYVGSYLPRWGVDREGVRIDIVEKVLVSLSKRFEGRPGGYTRTVKLGPRRGDGAQMSVIEFIDTPPPEDKVVEVAGTDVPEQAAAEAGPATGAEAPAAEVPATETPAEAPKAD